VTVRPYPPDSPQGWLAGVLADAGIRVDPSLVDDTPGIDGLVQVHLGAGSIVGGIGLGVVIAVAPGTDLWSLVMRCWQAILDSDKAGPLSWETGYLPDAHTATIDVITTFQPPGS